MSKYTSILAIALVLFSAGAIVIGANTSDNGNGNSTVDDNTSTGNETGNETLPPVGNETGNETLPPAGNETGNETLPPAGNETGNETVPPAGNDTGNATIPPGGNDTKPPAGTDTKPIVKPTETKKPVVTPPAKTVTHVKQPAKVVKTTSVPEYEKFIEITQIDLQKPGKQESFTVTNFGAFPIDIQGWDIQEKTCGSVVTIKKSIIIEPGESAKIYTKKDLGLKEHIFNAPDSARLVFETSWKQT